MKIREKYIAFGAPNFSVAEIEAVTRVINSGWIGMGQEVILFEEEMAKYVGVPEVVTVNSCTSALFLALLVEGIGKDDEVIVPSFTWCATANVALYLGAIPVFCDIDPLSMCVTPETIIAKITPRTKAVIVVHYGGYAIDIEALRDALPSHVAIIEDAAHAFGAKYPDGKRVGASKNSVCFSFYANKNISTADGGAIALFDANKAERLRSLRMNGLNSNAWSRFTKPSTVFVGTIAELGYKMNFTDLQAAIGRVQLSRLDEMEITRKLIANHYKKRFHELDLNIPLQSNVFCDGHARHLFVGLFDKTKTGMERDQILLALRSKNIGVSIHYKSLHSQPLYRQFNKCQLPLTEKLSEQIMTLPISAKMTLDDVDYVAEHLSLLITKSKMD